MKFLVFAALVVPLGLATPMPVPPDNPITDEKVELGRRLFADPRLSKDGTIACTSCHDPERAFTKPDAVSPGVFGRKGRRNSPTIVNRAWGRMFLWDGRATTLERQVLLPIQDPNEMDLEPAEAAQRVGVSLNDLSRALATYVRAQTSGNSRCDRFNGGERTALTLEERNGLRVFQGRGNCLMCHVGPNFSDEKLHNTGVAWLPQAAGDRSGGRFLDEGASAVTGKAEDHGVFKTPTLREVGLTAPYMHDGSMTTLEDVVEFYDHGGRPNPQLDPDMQRLALPAEGKRALVAFLKALSGSR